MASVRRNKQKNPSTHPAKIWCVFINGDLRNYTFQKRLLYSSKQWLTSYKCVVLPDPYYRIMIGLKREHHGSWVLLQVEYLYALGVTTKSSPPSPTAQLLNPTPAHLFQDEVMCSCGCWGLGKARCGDSARSHTGWREGFLAFRNGSQFNSLTDW